MDIKLNAHVRCEDGHAGHVVGLLIQPDKRRISHLVIQYMGETHIVLQDFAVNAVGDLVTLSCTRKQLFEQPLFVETEYIESSVERYEPMTATASIVIPHYEPVTYRVQHEHIPEGELDVRVGMRVYTKESLVIGHVENIITDSDNTQVTHIIIHTGHLWNERSMVIAVRHIKSFEDNGIYLRLSNAQIAILSHHRLDYTYR